MAKKTKEKTNKDNSLIKILISLSLLLLFLLGVFEAGNFGFFIKYLMLLLFGNSIIAFIITTIIVLYRFFKKKSFDLRFIIGLISFNLAASMFATYFMHENLIGFDEISSYIKNIPTMTDSYYIDKTNTFKGGILGAFIYSLFSAMISEIGVMILSTMLFVLSLILLVSGNTYKSIYNYILDKKTEHDNNKNVSTTKMKNIKADDTDIDCDVYQYDEIKKDNKARNKSLFITADNEKSKAVDIEEVNNDKPKDTIKVVSTKYDYK